MTVSSTRLGQIPPAGLLVAPQFPPGLGRIVVAVQKAALSPLVQIMGVVRVVRDPSRLCPLVRDLQRLEGVVMATLPRPAVHDVLNVIPSPQSETTTLRGTLGGDVWE